LLITSVIEALQPLQGGGRISIDDTTVNKQHRGTVRWRASGINKDPTHTCFNSIPLTLLGNSLLQDVTPPDECIQQPCANNTSLAVTLCKQRFDHRATQFMEEV